MIPLRDPDTVMRLSRLGCAHQTRLSFMRVLLRKLRREGWRFDRPAWQIDAKGVGHAVYRARGPRRTYCLVAFGHDLPEDQRTDRVIAEAWDATFTLVDGDPSPDDIARLAANVPLQEAGRVSDRELVLSRANRSARLWDHVVARLARGAQPDPVRLAEVGYLMRTTAVYGSGKFGAADHGALSGRALMDGPFRAEMLTVWLIRAFCLDLVEHMARATGGTDAVTLCPDMRRGLGIGNSTGLGMAPFLVNHPALLNAWISARETALARVRALPAADDGTRRGFAAALDQARTLVAGWRSDHPYQRRKLALLARDLEGLRRHLAHGPLLGPAPWDRLWTWAEAKLSPEGQDMTLSLMLEPHGALVDDLAEEMGADEAAQFQIDGSWDLRRLGACLRRHYGWALAYDYTDPERCAQFWYVSEAKQEPRLGRRAKDAGATLEQPLDIARRAAALAHDLRAASDGTVAAFLTRAPQHRRIVRRVQLCARAPYAEIRDNLIDAGTRPIDMLRAKLSFFGATRFDPRSDRWVRITMFQHAPFPHELHHLPEDAWAYGPVPLGALA